MLYPAFILLLAQYMSSPKIAQLYKYDCQARIFLLFCVYYGETSRNDKGKRTIGDICFYRLYEEYYVRTKSSLTGKRVKHDPAFKGTMKYAALLACASKIASVIYKRLPKEQKSRKKYQAMTGHAMQLLKKKMDIETVIELMSENEYK